MKRKSNNLFIFIKDMCWLSVLMAFLGVWTTALHPAGVPEIEIICRTPAISAYQGEKIILPLEIKNNGRESLRPAADLFFSYHLYDSKGKTLAYDNRRFPFPTTVKRFKTTSFPLAVYFDYKEPGDYIIRLDIVKEGQFWGSDRKWKTPELKLKLKGLASPPFASQYLPKRIQTGNPILDQEQALLRVTFLNCELYKGKQLMGFAAGSTYPAIWIRDTATFIAYALQFYPKETLTRSVELFLESQSPEGEIVDWVDMNGNTDKNTVETDQESSLVLAADELAQQDTAWLLKPVKGKKVYHRLEDALNWVWKNRLDSKFQLIYSGFTADWGDVDISFPDERARRLSDNSIKVLGIYTQAKYIQAVDSFIKLSSRMPKETQSKNLSTWKQRLNTLKSQTRKILYLKDKGYYIVHIVPSTDKYFKMEKEMLAVGGNTEAISAGLMNEQEIKRFLSVLEQRRKEYRLRSVSFTLIPPYPEGFFKHHLLTHPWSYQNGGEWDWIGGRLVTALFRNGFKKEGETYLLEIAKKNLANYCIFEWEDRSGTGRGALFYVGAAGVLGNAIMKGYLNN